MLYAQNSQHGVQAEVNILAKAFIVEGNTPIFVVPLRDEKRIILTFVDISETRSRVTCGQARSFERAVGASAET